MFATRRLYRRSPRCVAVLCALVTMVTMPEVASARFFDVPLPAPASAIESAPAAPAPTPVTTAVRDPGGYALSIALASSALLVAVIGSGYVTIRLRRPHHRTIQS